MPTFIRRAYDRSLLHRPTTRASHSQSYHPRNPSTKAARAATYAWETRTRNQKRPPSDFTYTPPSSRTERPSSTSSYSGQHYTRASHVDVLTGMRRTKEDKERELDKIRHENPLIRPFQVVVVLMLGTAVIFGFGH